MFPVTAPATSQQPGPKVHCWKRRCDKDHQPEHRAGDARHNRVQRRAPAGRLRRCLRHGALKRVADRGEQQEDRTENQRRPRADDALAIGPRLDAESDCGAGREARNREPSRAQSTVHAAQRSWGHARDQGDPRRSVFHRSRRRDRRVRCDRRATSAPTARPRRPPSIASPARSRVPSHAGTSPGRRGPTAPRTAARRLRRGCRGGTRRWTSTSCAHAHKRTGRDTSTPRPTAGRPPRDRRAHGGLADRASHPPCRAPTAAGPANSAAASANVAPGWTRPGPCRGGRRRTDRMGGSDIRCGGRHAGTLRR
jgi:hypothetical protein